MFNFFQEKIIQNILVGVLRAYLKLALKTTRWQLDIDPEAYPLLTCKYGEPALVVLWHEYLTLGSRLWWWGLSENPDLNFYVLISRNREGRIISKLISPWRIQTVQGSSNKQGQDKGGATAFRELLKHTKAGHVIAMTPDGPRGPRHQCHEGILKLALLSKRKIVPMGAYCHSVRLNTWDKLLIPLPFGRGKIICGKPMMVTRDNYDQSAADITSVLNDITSKAQK